MFNNHIENIYMPIILSILQEIDGEKQNKNSIKI